MTAKELVKALQRHIDEGKGDRQVVFDGQSYAGDWILVDGVMPGSESIHVYTGRPGGINLKASEYLEVL